MVDENVIQEVVAPTPLGNEVSEVVNVVSSSWNIGDVWEQATKMANGIIQMLAINVIIFIIFAVITFVIYFLLGRFLGGPHSGTIWNNKWFRAIIAFLICWLAFPYLLPYVYPAVMSFVSQAKGGI